MLVDSHVNLHHEMFADDVDEVIERARESGVRGMLTICDKLSSIEEMRRISERHQFIWRSVGVHPHFATDNASIRACDLTSQLIGPEVIGIGECGLDFHYNRASAEDQLTVFKAHIEAGQETGLPLIIHSREADDLMQRTLEDAMAIKPFTPLLHCYTSGIALAEAVMDMGGYISFSGIITFKNAEEVRQVARRMPRDRILVETDCPYLAPDPYRGRRCEPAHVNIVAAYLARLLEIDTDALRRQTTENFFRVFQRANAKALE